MKYVDVRINNKKYLYTILKNTYIWFEEYGIEYICMQYVQFEKYNASMGMNGNGWMLVDERLWTEGTEQTKWIELDGRNHINER